MPETTSYLALGLVVVFGILGVYISSLALRLKNARKDETLIHNLLDQ